MRTIGIRRHSYTKKGEARGKGSHLSTERQYGFTYSKFLYSKQKIDPFLKAFTGCAEQAGALVASANWNNMGATAS